MMFRQGDALAMACGRVLLAMHGEPKPEESDLIMDTAAKLNELADRVEQLEWALKCLKVERDERDEAFDGLVEVYEELLGRLRVFEQDGQTTMKAA